jgi:hypothetical protein
VDLGGNRGVGGLMPVDVDALLSLVESVKARKPQELREWVLAKCNAFAQIAELRKPVLLHRASLSGSTRKSIRSACSPFADTVTATMFSVCRN